MGLISFISGAWRTPRRGEAFVNGTWRRLTRGEAYIGGQWRSIVSFVQPLTLSANNADGASLNTTYVTATSTALPSGGLGPYRYQWTLTSGGPTIALTNATQSTATFSGVVPYFQGAYGSATVVCTDALGNTASTNISVFLYSERDTGNQ